MVTSSQAWTRLSVPRQCLGGHRKTNYNPETASKGPNWVTIRGQAPGSIFGPPATPLLSSPKNSEGNAFVVRTPPVPPSLAAHPLRLSVFKKCSHFCRCLELWDGVQFLESRGEGVG